MDGLSPVQARISEIQTRFTAPVAPHRHRGLGRRGLGRRARRHRRGRLRAPPAGGGTASETAVVAEAQKYLGVPYLWGGTDPAKGLDCSGFTQLVFGNLGIDLPRISSQQATAGTAVAVAGRGPPRRPGVLRPRPSARRHRPRRHLHRRRQDDRRAAGRASRQGAGRRQPGRDPPGAAQTQPPRRRCPPRPAASLAGVPYADLFTRAGNRHGVDPALLAAVASQESGFDSGAVSSAGAQGLMQFMPATARGLGVNPLDPASAIDGAAKYLSELTTQFGSTDLALAAYNAGPGTVSRYGGIPPYPETQNYVRVSAEQGGGLPMTAPVTPPVPAAAPRPATAERSAAAPTAPSRSPPPWTAP